MIICYMYKRAQRKSDSQDNNIIEADVCHGAINWIHHDCVVDFCPNLKQDKHCKPRKKVVNIRCGYFFDLILLVTFQLVIIQDGYIFSQQPWLKDYQALPYKILSQHILYINKGWKLYSSTLLWWFLANHKGADGS